MKDIHKIFNKGRYYFDLTILRVDIAKVQKQKAKQMKLDVLFGIGLGWSYPPNRFTRKRRFYFKLDLPAFGVKDVDYRSPIFFEFGGKRR